MSSLLIVSAVLFRSGFCDNPGVPESLQRARAQRSAENLRTARVDYSLTVPNGDTDEIPHTRFFTWRSAGPDYLNVDYGREDGVIHVKADGTPSDATFCGPISALLQDGQVWQHTEDCPEASVWPQSRVGRFALLDLRNIGFYPGNEYEDLEAARKNLGIEDYEYSEKSEDGLSIVTFQVKELGRFVWWIDPAKDWSVIRNATFDNTGKQIAETRFDYGLVDGYWFPQRIEKYDVAGENPVPSFQLEIIAAELNRPEHPPTLSKSDIGIEVGTRVTFEESDRPGAYWDGTKPVSRAEYLLRVNQGEITPGLNRQRVISRMQAAATRSMKLSERSSRPQATSHPAPPESDWERFTRQFIDVYELNAEQTQKALLICRECQGIARDFLDSKRKEIETIEAALLGKPSGEKSGAAREQVLRQRLEAVKAPAEAIFTSKLRPRLFKLPTKSQIETGRKKPTAIGPFAPDDVRK